MNKSQVRAMVSFSGGKNSSAMLIRLLELNYKIDAVVFADTLLEYPEMYKYIRKIENYLGIRIKRTYPKHTFFEWFFKRFKRGSLRGRIRGFPYVVSPCWYNREAKSIPLSEYNKRYNVVYVGYCKGEESRIMKDKKFKYPLIEWGWDDIQCRKYLTDKKMLNPLYEKFERLGCWLCPKQPDRNLVILERDYPALYNILIQLIKLSPHGFKPNKEYKIYKRQIFFDLKVSDYEFTRAIREGQNEKEEIDSK